MPYVFCKMPCVFFGVRIAHHRLTYFVATVYGKIKIKWYYCSLKLRKECNLLEMSVG